MIFQDEWPIGVEFPNEQDRRRVMELATNNALWHGDHEPHYTAIPAGLSEAETKALQRKWAGLNYLTLNVLGLSSEEYAEALTNDTIAVVTDTGDEQAQDIADASHWNVTITDMVEQASALGEMCIKVYRDEDGEVIIDDVHPSNVMCGESYFSEYRALVTDPREMAVPMAVEIINDGLKHYLLFEIHEPGEVIYRAYEWKVRKDLLGGREPTFADKVVIGAQVDVMDLPISVPSDYDTGLDVPTLFVVKNAGKSKRGRSDYSPDVVKLQGEINHQLSQIAQHFEELISGGTLVLSSKARAMVMMRGHDNNHAQTAKDFGRNLN